MSSGSSHPIVVDVLDSQHNAIKMWGPNSPGGSEAAMAPVMAPSDAPVSLPTIDLSMWHDEEYRTELASQIAADAHTMGFFYVKAPQAVSSFTWSNVNSTLAMCVKVFEETAEAERIKLAGPSNLQMLHGYQKFASQLGSLSQRAASTKECLAVGRLLACDRCDTVGGTRATDISVSDCPHESYPPAIRDFPSTVNQLRSSMEQVAQVLLDMFSLSLGQPIHFLRDLHQNPRSPLRLHHYPPTPHDPSVPVSERAIAAAEHTDYGTITLLLMARNDPGGLQVWLRDAAKWMDIPYREDCLVVNIGDLLMRWTNDRYVSNVHRVLVPETAIQQSVHRYSIAYFVTPAKETPIVPLLVSSAAAGGEQAKYPVVTAGEYGDAKRAANFQAQKSLA